MKQLLLSLSAVLLVFNLSAQNVGIGEVAPASKLAVEGSLSVGSSYSTTTAPSDGAIISGYLGVGTSSPGYPLEVATGSGTYQTAISVLPSTAVASRRAALKLDDWMILQDQYGGGIKDFAIYQASTNQQRLVIDPSGLVGIGTLTPLYELHVNGLGTSASLYLTSTSTGTSSGLQIAVGNAGDALFKLLGNRNMVFYTNGTERGRFTSTGNFGLGTSTPTNPLEVVGNTKTTNLQVTSGASLGYLLQSDASGNASWVSPSAVTTGQPIRLHYPPILSHLL